MADETSEPTTDASPEPTPAETLTNDDISGFLSRIAKMMKIAGVNVFKVRAFERASDALTGLSEPIAAIAERGELTKIDGVGKSIATDIDQMLATGTCEVWEELVEQYPQELLALLDIQGLGPKRVAAIYEAHGITTLDELRELAESGEIGKLKGFGKKTQDKILTELDRIEQLAGRTPIGQAVPQAEALREYLESVDGVDRVAVAGSLRRWAETIGDLDFIAVTAGDPMTVMDAFVAYDEVSDVIGEGPSKTSVRLRSGIQADLRVFEPGVWGSALHHFTGSKFHHIELRMRAQKRGLKISEYGVHDVESDELVAGATEEEVYAALDLPWIPPELREGRGEVAAADDGALPTLIEEAHMRGDLHMHTTASDGANSIVEMAEAAKDLGYEYICITDHSQAVVVANGLTPERVLEQLDAIREADEQVEGIRIFAGLEVDILRDGELDMPEDVLEKLDFVVGSIHSSMQLDRDAQTQRVIRAIESGCINAVGHPTGRRLARREGYDLDLDAVVETAKAHGVALEVNSSPNRLDLPDLLCRRVKEAGGTLIISSDAHSRRALQVLPFGVHTARRGWVERGDVLNALPLDEFMRAVGIAS